MATEDSLRLFVPSNEFATRIATLDSYITQLEGVLTDYEQLKAEATDVFGEDDSNLAKVRANVEVNIKAVKGNLQMLRENRAMLQKQMEELDILGDKYGQAFDESIQTAKSAFKSMKTITDLLGDE